MGRFPFYEIGVNRQVPLLIEFRFGEIRSRYQRWFLPLTCKRAVHRLLGNEEVRASLVQVEAAFDRGSMFRHLPKFCSHSELLHSVHVDEGDNHSVVIRFRLPVLFVRYREFRSVTADPTQGHEVSEMTISIGYGLSKAQRYRTAAL